MILRALIAVQIAWVALVGAVARGVFPAPSPLGWVEAAVFLTFYPALFAFPVGVHLALRRSGLPRWKTHAVAGVEAALVFATLVAALPAVQ